ncbi:Acyl-CoA dehydrogenase [Micromonospora nigra]|uniref:Acyl-CoA dehydrogenase n=1 Tax=Micromonospora nigra TaxID=145857 RepID=A0A1C6S3V2_9ACTN|nr:acyl-CoA dehydrogenase family protein [Micromonospora nigra]SCL23973.1 Acyl-CoA dehydrogenase [Micromonospora nigra]
MSQPADLLRAARELAATITARAPELDADRGLPADLLAQLKKAGFFRMFVPRSHHGHEVDLRVGLDVLETLARADASTGWTVMIGSETPHLVALLEREQFDKFYANGPDVIIAGGFNAQGVAEVVDGGYAVNGTWAFASGSAHADWIFGNCVVTRDGQPLPGATEGVPHLRSMLVPAGQAQIIDTWHVLGLRGTGSNDVAISNVRVPAEHTFDLFTGAPCVPGPGFVAPLVHFVLHLGAVAVGIAQGALDETVAMVNSGKQRLYAKNGLKDSPVFHVHLGRAELDVRAARALLHEVADEVWAACEHDPAALTELAPRASATLAWVTEAAVRAVDTCYRSGGGAVARNSSAIQRRFRDMHTFSQHAAVAEGWLATGGAALLGQPQGLAY